MRSSSSESKLVTACDKLGSVVTLLAMIPQGGFGMLLIDHEFTSQWGFVARGIADSLIFIAAEEGKRRLVRFFNREDFKQLPEKLPKICRELGRADNWTIKNIIKNVVISGGTLIVSGTFCGLAKISWDGVTHLLKSYDVSWLDDVAEVTADIRFQIPFMLCAFGANLLCFPNIYRGAAAAIQDMFRENTENGHEIEAVRLFFKRLYETDNENYLTNLSKFLNALKGTSRTDVSIRDVLISTERDENIPVRLQQDLVSKNIDAIITYKRTHTIQDAPAISCCERTTKFVAILAALGVLSVGFWNFKDLSLLAADANEAAFGLPERAWFSDTALEIGTYGSLLAMTLSVMYFNMKKWVEILFDRKRSVWVLSRESFYWILSTTLFICVFGGGPNAYQAYLDHEDTTMLSFAAIASFALESGGYFALTKSNFLRDLPSDSVESIAHLVDEKLTMLRDQTRGDSWILAQAKKVSELSLLNTSIFCCCRKKGYDVITDEIDDDHSKHFTRIETPPRHGRENCCIKMRRWFNNNIVGFFAHAPKGERTPLREEASPYDSLNDSTLTTGSVVNPL